MIKMLIRKSSTKTKFFEENDIQNQMHGILEPSNFFRISQLREIPPKIVV